jgi:hypothetical protein
MTEPNEGEDLDLKAIGDEIDGTTPDPAAETETVEATEETANPAADEQTQDEGQKSDVKAPVTTEAEVAIAGRKYKSQADANRAHDHLYRHASKLEQELATERKWGKQYRELEKVWKEQPDLFNTLKKAEADFYTAREGGATVKEAKQVSGMKNVPPEIMQQLKELREFKDRMSEKESERDFSAEESRLKTESTEFRAAHKDVDDAVFDAVTGIMLEYAEGRKEEISYEHGYEVYLVRQNRMAKTELERVRATANTSSPTGTSPKASKKPMDKQNDAEFYADMEQQLQGLPD